MYGSASFSPKWAPYSERWLKKKKKKSQTETVSPFLHTQHLLILSNHTPSHDKSSLPPQQPNPEPLSRCSLPHPLHPSGQKTASSAASPLGASPLRPTRQGSTPRRCSAQCPGRGPPGGEEGSPAPPPPRVIARARRGRLPWVSGRGAPPPPVGRGCGRRENRRVWWLLPWGGRAGSGARGGRGRGGARRGAGGRAGARGRGGGVCAGLGGQPRRTAAAGARGAGRKSLFTQTAHRLGNNAGKEVSRLGLTAPTSCSHTHQRGKKRGARERKKKGGGGIRISLQEQQTVCRRLSAWKVGGFRPVPPRNSPEEGSRKLPHIWVGSGASACCWDSCKVSLGAFFSPPSPFFSLARWGWGGGRLGMSCGPGLRGEAPGRGRSRDARVPAPPPTQRELRASPRAGPGGVGGCRDPALAAPGPEAAPRARRRGALGA